ncbi:hypothetical protein J3E69DRAFT_271419 [Trichoderma sp. SZMC 28015]
MLARCCVVVLCRYSIIFFNGTGTLGTVPAPSRHQTSCLLSPTTVGIKHLLNHPFQTASSALFGPFARLIAESALFLLCLCLRRVSPHFTSALYKRCRLLLYTTNQLLYALTRMRVAGTPGLTNASDHLDVQSHYITLTNWPMEQSKRHRWLGGWAIGASLVAPHRPARLVSWADSTP